MGLADRASLHGHFFSCLARESFVVPPLHEGLVCLGAKWDRFFSDTIFFKSSFLSMMVDLRAPLPSAPNHQARLDVPFQFFSGSCPSSSIVSLYSDVYNRSR